MYVKAYKLFREHQGVYRCGKSSEQILMYAIDKIANALDQHLIVCSTFLDLKKTYDLLDCVILLKQLQCLGVHGIYVELKWFTDCLSGRTNKTGYQLLKLGTYLWGYTSRQCPWTLSIAKYVCTLILLYLSIFKTLHHRNQLAIPAGSC